MVVAAGLVDPPRTDGGDLASEERLRLPRPVQTKHAGLAVSHPEAQARVVRLPTSDRRESVLSRLRKTLGVGSEVRVNGISLGGGGSEGAYLAAAMPEPVARRALGLVGTGTPVPVSLEVAGVSALSTWARTQGPRHAKDAVAVIDGGASSLTFALFAEGTLSLLRTFPFGAEDMMGAVCEELDLDRSLARSLLDDPPVDISPAIARVVGPFVEQLGVARDYVERRHRTRLTGVYLSGGLGHSGFWARFVKASSGLPVREWDLWEGLQMGSDALRDFPRDETFRLSAAVGAALHAMEAA